MIEKTGKPLSELRKADYERAMKDRGFKNEEIKGKTIPEMISMLERLLGSGSAGAGAGAPASEVRDKDVEELFGIGEGAM